jgi:NitT/TauT family transport system ATP-binding protein
MTDLLEDKMTNSTEELDKIKILGINKTYDSLTKSQPIKAIEDFSLCVKKSEIICILGRSGCGKTTFLNILAGLIPQSSGTISIFGKNSFESKSDITYIQQNPHLLPYRNVFTNAALALELKNELSEEKLNKLEELLDFLGFKDFYSYYPPELSGGMRQRLALARTLSIDASVVLCDEPFSSLDFDTRLEIENFFWNSIKNNKQTSIFVTHHIDSAVALADRIVILTPRPAKISKVISLDREFQILTPSDRRNSKEFADYYSKVWDSLKHSI